MTGPGATDEAALAGALDYVRSWLPWRLPRARVPGCQVAVAHRGEVVLSEAWGVADEATGEALRPDHVFRVASHSKTFTATLALQLAEEGRLRLEDPVVEHLGWLRGHPDERLGWTTLGQLLEHGSGMVRDGADTDYWQLSRPFPQEEAFREEILGAALVTDPDVALKYSNYGYTLAGLVLEAVTGQGYAELVAERLTGPLDLAGTVAEPVAGAPRLVAGHGRLEASRPRRRVPHVDTAAMAPATGFASTATDLARWFSAHMVGSGLLLPDRVKRRMQRTRWHAERMRGAHVDYGIGLMVEHVGERRTFGHGGGFPGQITRSMADPAAGLVVVVLTNAADGPANDIAKGILGVVDHHVTRVGQPRPTGLQGLEGRWVNLWEQLDLLVSGEVVAVAEPDSWAPLAEPDELAVGEDGVARVVATSSFGGAGEPVALQADGTLRYAGATMWRPEAWEAEESRLLGG